MLVCERHEAKLLQTFLSIKNNQNQKQLALTYTRWRQPIGRARSGQQYLDCCWVELLLGYSCIRRWCGRNWKFPFWSCYSRKDAIKVEWIQGRFTGILPGFEGLSYNERLSRLRHFNPWCAGSWGVIQGMGIENWRARVKVGEDRFNRNLKDTFFHTWWLVYGRSCQRM